MGVERDQQHERQERKRHQSQPERRPWTPLRRGDAQQQVQARDHQQGRIGVDDPHADRDDERHQQRCHSRRLAWARARCRRRLDAADSRPQPRAHPDADRAGCRAATGVGAGQHPEPQAPHERGPGKPGQTQHERARQYGRGHREAERERAGQDRCRGSRRQHRGRTERKREQGAYEERQRARERPPDPAGRRLSRAPRARQAVNEHHERRQQQGADQQAQRPGRDDLFGEHDSGLRLGFDSRRGVERVDRAERGAAHPFESFGADRGARAGGAFATELHEHRRHAGGVEHPLFAGREPEGQVRELTERARTTRLHARFSHDRARDGPLQLVGRAAIAV